SLGDTASPSLRMTRARPPSATTTQVLCLIRGFAIHILLVPVKNNAQAAIGVSIMRQWQNEIAVATNGQGLYEMTVAARQFVHDSGIGLGQLTFFIRHTSASLLIQEAADPNVGRDLQEFL